MRLRTISLSVIFTALSAQIFAGAKTEEKPAKFDLVPPILKKDHALDSSKAIKDDCANYGIECVSGQEALTGEHKRKYREALDAKTPKGKYGDWDVKETPGITGKNKTHVTRKDKKTVATIGLTLPGGESIDMPIYKD